MSSQHEIRYTGELHEDEGCSSGYKQMSLSRTLVGRLYGTVLVETARCRLAGRANGEALDGI
jgi:hypothetical protein